MSAKDGEIYRRPKRFVKKSVARDLGRFRASLVEQESLAKRPERRLVAGPPGRDLGERRPGDDLLAKPPGPRDHVERERLVDVLVGRLLPLEPVRVERVDGAQHRDPGEHGRERLAVVDVDLESAAE